jgi:hypothetical protein
MKTRDLPPRLHFKDGGYYYVKNNKWTHMGGDLKSATVRYRAMEHNLSINEDWRPAWAGMNTYIRQVLCSAKKNARTRGIPFELTSAEFNQIAERAKGRCEVTGIVFQLKVRPGSARRPFAPSLDRIESSKPYTFENCRLICGIVNAAMSDWGDGAFWFMVNKARRLRGRALKQRGIQ